MIKKDPAVANVIAFTGGGGATNTGNLYVALKPLAERKVSAPQIINRLRPQLNRLPVASAFLQPAQDLRIGGRAATRCTNTRSRPTTCRICSSGGRTYWLQMKKLPGLQDVSSDQQNGGLDELMNYDRVTAAKLGITVQSLDSTLYSAFGQSEVSIIYTQLNQYYVVLEVAPQYWQSPEGLKDIYLHTSDSRQYSAVRGVQGPSQHNAPGHQPHGIIPLGHGVIQSCSERIFERRDSGHRPDAEAPRHAFHAARLFRRHPSGLSAVAGHRARTHRDGVAGGLHRPGHFV